MFAEFLENRCRGRAGRVRPRRLDSSGSTTTPFIDLYYRYVDADGRPTGENLLTAEHIAAIRAFEERLLALPGLADYCHYQMEHLNGTLLESFGSDFFSP